MEDLIISTFAAVNVGEWIEKFTNVAAVILGLGLVIFFHELGHFAVAKWCDVHVERFSIGIGPILWSRQRGETEYALSALPFGGYVKMLGQDDMDPNQMTSSEIAENARSYSAKSVPQRMAIISAGVTMNVITGFLFYVICYWCGVFETSPTVGIVRVGSPAWEVGMASGDRITKINGEQIRSFMDVQEAIMLSSGEVEVEGTHADESPFKYTITPAKLGPGRSIGVGPATLCELMNRIPDPALISEAGMPLEKASGAFQQGDKIVAVKVKPPGATSSEKAAAPAADAAKAEPPQEGNPAPAADPQPVVAATPTEPIPVSMLFQLRQVLGRYADRELTYVVERMDPENPEAPRTTVEIDIPPQQVRSLGFWMAMGPVRAVQKGSIAEKAGLKVGDEIRKVDGQALGTDMDPLSLPTYFAKKAGQT
ncbi:MAG: RIP metalloprotease RseP, partial [Planctomycetaceae bacterium]|nr:RIP metalloprotease RseP [Planctomycetaceae bacterium]